MPSCTCVHMNIHRHKNKVKQVCKNTVGDSYSNNKAEYGDTCLSSRGQMKPLNPEGKYMILLMWNLENVQFIEMWSTIMASRNKEEYEMVVPRHNALVVFDELILEPECTG